MTKELYNCFQFICIILWLDTTPLIAQLLLRFITSWFHYFACQLFTLFILLSIILVTRELLWDLTTLLEDTNVINVIIMDYNKVRKISLKNFEVKSFVE